MDFSRIAPGFLLNWCFLQSRADVVRAFTADTAWNAYNASKWNQVTISNNNQKQAKDDPHNKHKQGKPVASAI